MEAQNMARQLPVVIVVWKMMVQNLFMQYVSK